MTHDQKLADFRRRARHQAVMTGGSLLVHDLISEVAQLYAEIDAFAKTFDAEVMKRHGGKQ